MSLMDDVRRRAEGRSTFNPVAAGMRPEVRARSVRPASSQFAGNNLFPNSFGDPGSRVVQPNPNPFQGTVGGIDWSKLNPSNQRWLQQNPDLGIGSLKSPSEGDGGFGPGDVFGGIIKVADAGRNLVAASLIEASAGIDGLTNWEGGVSPQRWWDNLNRRVPGAEVLGLHDLDEDAPAWQRIGATAAGVGADIIMDPLTYLTAGTVSAAARSAGASRAIRGGSELDNALRYGSRRTLATTVAEQAARRQIEHTAIDELIRQAGMRGRGAFTKRGLKRSGADQQLLRDLGLNVGFGYSTRLAGQRLGAIPGSRAAAELSENIKGSIKKWAGSSKAGEINRRLFTHDTERVLLQELMSGGANAATAARGLAILQIAKGDAYKWMDVAARSANRNMPDLKKLDDDAARLITHNIEDGIFDGLSGNVHRWYEDMGRQLQDMGVEFDWANNYVNHMFSSRAVREFADQNSQLRQAVRREGLDVNEQFQMARSLRGGDRFLGEVIPGDPKRFATIKTLNEISERKLGFKVFEDDIRVLMGAYLESGKNAALRGRQRQLASEMGVAQPRPRKVDQTKVEDELADLVKQEEAAMKAAIKARREASKEASKGVIGARSAAVKQATEATRKADAAVRKHKRLEERVTKLRGELAASESALRWWKMVLDENTKKAGRARTAEKSAATRKITKLTKEREGLQQRLDAANARLQRVIQGGEFDNVSGTMRTRAAVEASREARAARQAVTDANVNLEKLSAQRAALQNQPLDVDPGLVRQVERAQEAVEKHRQAFISGQDEMLEAAAARTWLEIDQAAAVGRMENILDNIDQIRIPFKRVHGESLRRERDELRKRVGYIRGMLNDIPDSDPTAQIVARLEAQAAVHDMNAWKARAKGAPLRQIDYDKVLDDPAFQRFVVDSLDDGFRALNDKLQIPAWYDEAITVVERLRDPSEWRHMKQMLKAYDKWHNWWKGWATGSPGFAVRNWYSGMFSLYLDNVSPLSAQRTYGYLRRYRKDPEEARQWAIRKHGGDTTFADEMDEAMAAAAATGWGLTPQEVNEAMVGRKLSYWNMASTTFAPIAKMRDISTFGESHIRLTQAYDAIHRGGSRTQAIDRINKFQFNYRDITDFDRAVKRVMPFWTFFSRNLAIQAEVWTHSPQKLNRTYYNLRANMEATTDAEDVVPGYFEELGAIRTPFGLGNQQGDKYYLTPDLPSLRFRRDLFSSFGVDPSSDSLRPSPRGFAANLGPAPQAILQPIANQQFFTGFDYKNRLYEFDSVGNRVQRNAPRPFQIPGVKHALDFLGGDTTAIAPDGNLLMQDNVEDALNNVFLPAERAKRLLPNNDRWRDRHHQSLLSFAGVPIRQNTVQMQRGAQFSESRARRLEAEKQAREQLLRSFGG